MYSISTRKNRQSLTVFGELGVSPVISVTLWHHNPGHHRVQPRVRLRALSGGRAHQQPQSDAHPGLDGQLKLPISLPIGCSRFDWFVINSSYWAVEQDGWRHAFVLLTHYPTEPGLRGGGS